MEVEQAYSTPSGRPRLPTPAVCIPLMCWCVPPVFDASCLFSSRLAAGGPSRRSSRCEAVTVPVAKLRISDQKLRGPTSCLRPRVAKTCRQPVQAPKARAPTCAQRGGSSRGNPAAAATATPERQVRNLGCRALNKAVKGAGATRRRGIGLSHSFERVAAVLPRVQCPRRGLPRLRRRPCRRRSCPLLKNDSRRAGGDEFEM